jgi:hypothetical protein
MKKAITVLAILLLAAIVSIYFFIPGNIKISYANSVDVSDKRALDFLSSAEGWSKWFPGEKDDRRRAFIFNKQRFLPGTSFHDAVNVNLEGDGLSAVTQIQLLPLKKDSVKLIWELSLDGSMNPFRRIKQYRAAVEIKENIKIVLDHFVAWVDKTENVYGVHIEHGKIQDSVLLSTRTIFNHYPSDSEVYNLLQKLRIYFEKFDARETGIPMLNVTNMEKAVYQTQVAIPIDKDVPETEAIRMKYMFKGNALTTDVKGGVYKINQALNALETYRRDYALLSPAIPFQSMITDRIKQKDSTMWVTRIYYPVY